MKIEFIGILVTLLLGIFILIGAIIAFFAKRKQKCIDFSLGLAFSVIIMLIVIDLIPEVIEHLGLKHIWIFLICVFVGFMFLKILDNFIPDHEDDKMSKKELSDNLVHIGVVSSIALVLHNIIEGMAIYSTVLTDTHTGLMLSIGVGFHNLPLGMVIATTFYQSNQSIKKTLLIILTVALSTCLGGILILLFNNLVTNEIILGGLLSVTLGMLLFIAFYELLPRIKKSKNKESRNMGILLGILLLLSSFFF